jgi:tetratricopeptide (TPR) repeat protein
MQVLSKSVLFLGLMVAGGMPPVFCADGPGLLPGTDSGSRLSQARERWLHGNYEEALALYQKLSRTGGQRVPAILGLSRALQSKGEYGNALNTIEAAVAEQPGQPDLEARRAELLYLRGRLEESFRAAEKVLQARPEHFLARWVRAQIYRDRADFKQADSELRWFVRTYTDRSNKDQEIKDPDDLLLVGLAGTENARWHNLSDQYRVILTDVYGDALKSDAAFWPAEYQAGALLLEKYNRGEALDAFDKALTINPSAAEALVGKGLAFLQRYEVYQAEQFAERALRINPNLPEGLRLRADIHLLAGDLAAAGRDLDRAKTINPRDERTLGRCAARLFLLRDEQSLARLVQEVKGIDPRPGLFYFELAERLEERRYYEAAEKYYRLAMAERPMLPWARNSLGLLCMRLGRETEAREILSEGFKADEFNVRVSNSLKVLRHLERYQTLRTEHFELRYDPHSDALLARYMAPYLESIYQELAKRFEYRPSGPILVEIFNNHEMFSGRTIALPDLHTIGACTGKVLAMVSPHGQGIGKPFNWSRVLHHELVHVFNLEQTHFQVTHWFTEGLAVSNEGFPRPQEWNRILQERVRSGGLMNLENIDLGFIRPRSPLDWHLAYCQSQLYIQFMQEKYGPKVIGEILAAYAEGLDTAAAIARVCHTDLPAFEKDYRAFVQNLVKTIQGRSVEKRGTFSELQAAHEGDPENLDVSARLSEQYLIRRDKKEARKLADSVLAKKEWQPLACYVKARLLIDAGDEDQARALLEKGLDRKTPHMKVLQLLAKLYFEAAEFDRAAALYELAHKIEPYESKWLVELVRVYTRSGNSAKRIQALIELVPTEADDLEQRKRLSHLLLEEKRFAEAERYARECLEIDVRDVEAQEYLEKALAGQNKHEEAAKLRELLKGSPPPSRSRTTE